MRNAQQSPALSWGGYPPAPRRDLAARPDSAGAAQGRAGQQPQEQGDERLRVVAQAARVEWRSRGVTLRHPARAYPGAGVTLAPTMPPPPLAVLVSSRLPDGREAAD